MLFNRPNIVKLSELTEEMGFANDRATKKWLDEKAIPYEKRGGGIQIFKWNIDFFLQLEIIEGLMKRFPLTWAKIYEAVAEDVKMVKAVFAVYPPQVKAVRVKKNKDEKKYF